MERKLRALFDLQAFERNEDLQQVIDQVHARYARRELDLEEAGMVNAAGDPAAFQKKKEEVRNAKMREYQLWILNRYIPITIKK